MQNAEISEKGDERKDRDSNTMIKEDTDSIMITGSPGQLNCEKERDERVEECIPSSSQNSNEKDESTFLNIVLSNADFPQQNSCIDDLKKTIAQSPKSPDIEKIVKSNNATPRKCFSPMSDGEQCRVCQQHGEEPIMNLGCQCRGELGNAHESCIRIWFHTRGNNRCEICKEIATNVPFSETQSKKSCSKPVWIAFSILIGGFLLDVVISVSLGVSSFPVNIIIGVLVVLGLGTALRLVLECYHEWNIRRVTRRADTNVNAGYFPSV